MVLVDERLQPRASWEFDADIAILTHSTTITPRYQAVIHCEIIRQAARVVAMDRERLRWATPGYWGRCWGGCWGCCRGRWRCSTCCGRAPAAGLA
jgi:hypothetical protein